jgi:acetyl esterase
MLDDDAHDWFNWQYAPDPALWLTPYVSPPSAEDFSGLPTTLIFTAECDPLRDEGYMYAQSLEKAGWRFDTHAIKGWFTHFLCSNDFQRGNVPCYLWTSYIFI